MAFFSCEVLNVAIVVSQFFLTNLFLDHQFLWYGPAVLMWVAIEKLTHFFSIYTLMFLPHLHCRFYSLPQEEADMRGILNPMCEVFPRVAKCTFYKYGSGGRQNCKQVKISVHDRFHIKSGPYYSPWSVVYPFTKYCHRQGLPSLMVLVHFGWIARKYQSWVPGSANDVSQHSILHDENQNAAVKSLSNSTSKLG